MWTELGIHLTWKGYIYEIVIGLNWDKKPFIRIGKFWNED